MESLKASPYLEVKVLDDSFIEISDNNESFLSSFIPPQRFFLRFIKADWISVSDG